LEHSSAANLGWPTAPRRPIVKMPALVCAGN
jgi:hypothetical protein